MNDPGPSSVTLYARPGAAGASIARTMAAATLPAYTHDNRFVPGPTCGTIPNRTARTTRGENSRSYSP